MLSLRQNVYFLPILIGLGTRRSWVTLAFRALTRFFNVSMS